MKNNLPTTPRPTLLLAIVPILLIVATLALLPMGAIQGPTLEVALVCTFAYVVSSLAAGGAEHTQWAGYLNLSITVAWLTIGLPAALAVLLIGEAIADLIRRRGFMYFPEGSLPTHREVARQGMTRVTIHGAAATLGSTVYYLLHGKIPLMNIVTLDVLPLVIAFAIVYVVTQALAIVVAEKNPNELNTKALWSPTGMQILTTEVLLMGVTAALSVVLFNLGSAVFILLMLLVVAQTYRQRQLQVAQEKLVRRVGELAILNTVGQNVAANLLLDEVLMSIYTECAKLIDMQLFYIALVDARNDRLDYRIVVRGGQRVEAPFQPVAEGLNAFVIRTRSMLQISPDDTEALTVAGIHDWNDEYAAFLGVPLLVGPKLLGVMAAASTTGPDAFSSTDSKLFQTVANHASLTIRNATLYDRSIEMTQNLSLINQSVQDVMFNLDSEDAMRAACQTAMEITHADRAAIFLLEVDEKNLIRLAQSVGLTESYRERCQSREYDVGIFKDGPHFVADTAASNNADLQALATLGGFRAFVEVPLRSGNTIIGFISVYHNAPHAYPRIELDLLETLANQITSALDNAELLKALELYASEQAQLVHLSRISTSTLELNKVIASISEMMSQMMGVRRVQIGLLTPGRERLQLYGSSGGQYGFQLESDTILLASVPELETIIQSTPPSPRLFLSSENNHSAALAQMMAANQDAMMVIVPMVANNDPIGVIMLSDPAPRVFTDSDWRLVEMAANQITAQIHNAQIYTLTEEALIQRLQQLALIEDIAQQISRSLDLELIIRNVLEAAIRAAQADIAALGLIDQTGEMRIIVLQYDAGEWHQYTLERPQDEGVMGHVLRTGESLLVADNRTVDYYVSEHEDKYLSSLVVPLIKDMAVIGVLNVESEHADFFREEQASFIRNLAGHAMISIDNARLLGERQRQIETLTRLREMGLRLSSAIDKRSVASVLVKTALRILQAQGAALFQYHQQTDEIALLSATSEESPELQDGEPTLLPADIARRAVDTGEIQFVENAGAERGDGGYSSIVAVPVKRGSEVYHVLCVAFVKKRTLDEREQNTLDLLAAQAAGHLENAMLHERILADSNRMRAILDSARDGIILLDRTGRLLDVNPSAEAILGISLADHLNEDFVALLMSHADPSVGEDDERTKMARILRLQPDRITSREYTFIQNDQPVYIKEVGSPVRDAHNTIIGRLLVLTDVTEEKSLAAYREKIRRMVFHDLRGPLGSIISSMTFALELVQDPGDMPLQETLVPTVEVSLESAVSLLQLVDSLLDIAKMQSNQLVPRPTIIGVDALANKALLSLEATIRKAGIDITIDIDSDLPEVNVDADLIRRVFTNLVHNAIRYTPENGQIMISAHKEADKPQAVVRVADSGPGIAPKFRDQIFLEFEQIEEQNPERGGKGSGLGLTFCKLAVEAHGGTIWVEDTSPLPGACFAFTLPLAAGESLPESTPSAEQSGS